MKILKNLLGNNYNTKIDIDEIARVVNGKVELLGDLVDIESGSNSNGSYVKYPDGTMICYMKVTGLHHDKNTSATFPVEFADIPIATATIARGGGYNDLGVMIKTLQKHYLSLYPFGSLPDNIHANVISIGLWK